MDIQEILLKHTNRNLNLNDVYVSIMKPSLSQPWEVSKVIMSTVENNNYYADLDLIHS